MTDRLEMPLDKFAEAVAKENERLISGPGGIMEMKQTIADKERRIQKLEAALQEITESARLVGDYYHVKIARQALEID